MIYKFLKNIKASSAIEFAILLPMILIMYGGFVTITTANKMSGKVSQVASTISDLLAQSTNLDTTTIDNILKAGEAIAGTANAQQMQIEAIGIAIDENQLTQIVWSRDKNGDTPYAVGSSYNLPSELITANTQFVVASEARINFTPTILPAYVSFVSIPISYKFYFVPRRSLTTTCDTC